ncbi:unnamed protein product [Trichogramma brassicae]|uniref:Uncharacterized protein n=1 Tax=Trichogramma brassicae TaxID=86971 RepID=A0A6H5IHX4_9HYME|nr:unnamed protein product [Trichogramma brassicae]
MSEWHALLAMIWYIDTRRIYADAQAHGRGGKRIAGDPRGAVQGSSSKQQMLFSQAFIYVRASTFIRQVRILEESSFDALSQSETSGPSSAHRRTRSSCARKKTALRASLRAIYREMVLHEAREQVRIATRAQLELIVPLCSTRQAICSRSALYQLRLFAETD